MTEGDLEGALRTARERVNAAGIALQNKHRGGEWEEYRAARAECLAAERALAAARNEEYAVRCPGFPRWDSGAPQPHLLTAGRDTHLLYHVREPGPPGPFTADQVRIVTPNDESTSGTAVVRFELSTSARIGAPNDEVLSGHPLSKRGLELYEAHEVMNSRWLAELQAINAVHSQYDPAHWKTNRHFLLVFKDEMFECIAQGFTATIVRTTLTAAARASLEEIAR